MSQQIHRNTFEGGLNSDVSGNLIKPNQYTDANNVTLVGDRFTSLTAGNFLSLTSLKGTTNLQEIVTATSCDVLGVFTSKYTIGTSTGVDCLTIFTHETTTGVNTFKITAYDTVNDDVYLLYSEVVGNDYLTSERVVDAVLYPENELDILYFTDNYFRPRKLRCSIPVGYAGAFLVAQDLELIKPPALGPVVVTSIDAGGSLLTGTYQIAYQLYNPDTNKYTGFSLLTNPIHVYYKPGAGIYSAGVGVGSDRKIRINITPTEKELAYYTHFRVAVVENIGTSSTPTTTVGVTSLELISDYEVVDVITSYEITSNSQYNYTTIDEIVIDFAAIQTAKTLTVKDNRLLLGNIVNSELEYDNGDPEITSGAIEIRTSIVNTSELELFQSASRGHFRDEVYRFAISYFDENGYYSAPKTLDLSSITYNQITGGIGDVKFPARGYYESGTYFSIFNSDSFIQHLGLDLNGITNHPTWAKGFIILRAKRKKNILFQTPVIPMVKLSGLGAVANYPTEYRTGSALTTVTNADLEPMGPSTVFVPYNMFLHAPAGSNSLTTTSGNSGTVNEYQSGEAMPLAYQTEADFVMIFPPNYMYNDEQETLYGSEKLKTVDASLCTIFESYYTSTQSSDLQGIKTNISANFHSLKNNLQYYNSGHTKSLDTLRTNPVPLKNISYFDNNDSGRLFLGSSIMEYNKLMTQGLDWGVAPNIQKSAVVQFNDEIISAFNNPPDFENGESSLIEYDTSDNSQDNTLTRVYFPVSVSLINSLMSFNSFGGASLGNWNVGTNTPALADSTSGTNGTYYTVTGAGGGGTLFDFNSGKRPSVRVYNGDRVYRLQLTSGTFGRWEVFRSADTERLWRSNVIEICNVTNNLDDYRYGDPDDYNEFMFTGTKVVFSDSSVASETQPSSDVSVWGGDCVVSPHTFKITDNTYSIVNQMKYTDHAFTTKGLVNGENWQTTWLTSGDDATISMPAFFTNSGQYLTVMLESEYNGNIVDFSESEYLDTDNDSDINIIGAPTETLARLNRSYNYNINLNKENDQKLFIPIDSVQDTITNYPSRLLYSDLKIAQTDIDGFDSFRILNTFDLSGAYGGITKLATIGDRLFSVQESGIAAIPVGERVLETTDSSQLAVRSGEFLSNPLYLDTLHGSKSLRSFSTNGKILYFLDNINKKVHALDQSGGIQTISDNGINYKLREILTSSTLNNDIISGYDPVRNQYWIANKNGDFCYIWNDLLNKWESNLTFFEDSLGGLAYINQKLYIVGKDVDDDRTTVYSMHTGDRSSFCGLLITPNVTFMVNSDPDTSKVYDAVLANSYDAPNGSSSYIKTFHNSGTSVAPFTTFQSLGKEENWRGKVMRDTNGALDPESVRAERIRGPLASVLLQWTNNGSIVDLKSVLTKYRQSFNIF